LKSWLIGAQNVKILELWSWGWELNPPSVEMSPAYSPFFVIAELQQHIVNRVEVTFSRLEVSVVSGPIDIVRSIHNAFRRDVSQIGASAFKLARNGGDLTPVFDRLCTMAEILDYHAQGEEAAVFPAVDNLTPLVAQAYFLDHRELDTMVNGLETMRKTPDPLITARATAVLESHLRIHLDKEDAHLYPILRKRTTESEQVSIVGLMSRKVPPERFPALIQWLLPLLDFDDRVVVAEGWMKLMPRQVFAGLKPLMRKIMAEDWLELSRRIPNLDSK
jgi:iron-sulfur cluster repair protein YtfE (RIC family)